MCLKTGTFLLLEKYVCCCFVGSYEVLVLAFSGAEVNLSVGKSSVSNFMGACGGVVAFECGNESKCG